MRYSKLFFTKDLIMKKVFAKLKKIALVKNNKQSVPADYIYERPLEYSFTLLSLASNRVKTVMDVGSGKSAFPALLQNCGFEVTAIDKVDDYWGSKRVSLNKYFHVINDDIVNLCRDYGVFDAITCISVLEHITDFSKALKTMTFLVKEGGIVILTFPWASDGYIPNVYDLPESDIMSKKFQYIAQSFDDECLRKWKKTLPIEEIERKYIRAWEGKYWRCGKRIHYPYYVDDEKKANALCITFKKI